MPWTGRLVTGPDTAVSKTFETYEDGVEWLKQNEPALLDAKFKLDKPDIKQWGMDYYWFCLTRWEGWD